MTQTAIESIPETLPERIRAARKAKKITLAQLAQMVGRDVRTVAGWQSTPPRSTPSLEMLRALAAALDERPSYFLGEEIQ